MSKRKHAKRAGRRKVRARHIASSGPVWHQTAEEVTLAQMPRYDAHVWGTGIHGDTKYNRTRSKRTWQRELERSEGELRHGIEEARARGPLPVFPSRKRRSARVRRPGTARRLDTFPTRSHSEAARA